MECKLDWNESKEIESESISPDMRRILAERLKTIERDAKDSVDARQALVDIRQNLKHPHPVDPCSPHETGTNRYYGT